MPEVNTKAIINGTPRKVIQLAYEAMKEDHNEVTAKDFYETYASYDIPVLLENSRYIFAEPIYGTEFYRSFMESGCIPFSSYMEEREKIKELMVNQDSSMNESTKKWYTSLYESVDQLCERHKNCAVMEQTLSENQDCVNRFITEAYKRLHGADNQSVLVEAYQELSPLAKILYLTETATRLDMEYELIETINSFPTDCIATESMNDFSNGMDLILLMNRIGKDSVIQEAVANFENVHLRMIYRGLTKESALELLQEAMENHLDEVPGDMDLPMDETVNYLLEKAIDDEDGFYTESGKVGEFTNTLRKYILYEHCLSEVIEEAAVASSDAITDQSVVKEFALAQGFDPLTVTVDDAIIMMTEAVSELREHLSDLIHVSYLKEYRDDGKQTNLMRRTASNILEEENSKASKNGKSDQWKKDIRDELSDDEKEKSEEKEEKPIMPKQDLHTKVQSVALDADVKAKTVGGKVKKIATDIKQTGKAVLRVPGNLVNGVKSMISDFNAWDDNRKKAEILKPGFRKGFWSKFRTVLTYGISFAINPLLVIVTYMCRTAAREKNKYLRNELALELQTEIKVVSAKIEDANSKGDNSQKYQLMRIQDKLEKERIRVISNSKYV